MVNKDRDTEQHILAAAKDIFFTNGFAGARMQDIADAAGINKALLHYYFRSKEKLFQVIFWDAVSHFFKVLNEIFSSNIPLFDKIRKFSCAYIDMVKEKPHLPLFVIYELNRNPGLFMKKATTDASQPKPQLFLQQIKEEMERGTIRNDIEPVQILLNILSLTIFPFLAKTMIKNNLKLSDKQFNAEMEKRKELIPEFVINAIRKN